MPDRRPRGGVLSSRFRGLGSRLLSGLLLFLWGPPPPLRPFFAFAAHEKRFRVWMLDLAAKAVVAMDSRGLALVDRSE